MFNNNNPLGLQKELNGLSKVMGRRDIETTFHGDGAWADNKTINVPAMDLDATLSNAEMAAMRGYHIHEVAHITDTDYGLWNSKRCTKEKRATWNAMEDVLIERKAVEQYAGARKNLEATCNMVLERENAIDQEHRDNGVDPYAKWWDHIDYAALQMARKQMGYESPALDEYLRAMPEKLREEARKFVGDAIAADGTQETFDLATKIRKRMGKVQRDQEKEEDESTRTTKGKEGEGKEGEGQQGDGDDDGQQGQGQGQGDDDGGSTGQGTSTQERMERGDNIANDIAGNHAGKNKKLGIMETRVANPFVGYDAFHQYILAKIEKHGMSGRDQRCLERWSKPTWHLQYKNILKVVREDTTTRQYSARLARLLLAREDKRFVGGHLDGRIDRRRLAQLVAGQRNVFAHQETLRTDDTIVSIVVDSSGSMEETPTRLALVSLNECLGAANVDYEILSWTGYSSSHALNKRCPFHSSGLVELKNATQRGNNPQVQKNIANILSQEGGTPTFSAIQAVAQRCIKHTQTRRVVLFLTDGVPDDGHTECKEVRKVVDAMSRTGIETIGIGIECSVVAMNTMFQDNFVDVNFSSLGMSLLGQIESLLIGRSHEAA